MRSVRVPRRREFIAHEQQMHQLDIALLDVLNEREQRGGVSPRCRW
jgi:hypothetical protein